MANFVSIRNGIKSALSGSGYVVYSYPNESMFSPAVVISPGEPYVEPINRSSAYLNFDLVVLVGIADNQAALAKLEEMILLVTGKVLNSYAIGNWSSPSRQEISGSEYLISKTSLQVATNY